MGTLLITSSSASSSCICRSRTARYSHSRKSCSTSCHGRMFSFRRATLTLYDHTKHHSGFSRKFCLLATCKCYNTREVASRCAALIPHPQEKLSRQCMDFVTVEEERLECGRRRIYGKKGQYHNTQQREVHTTRTKYGPVLGE